MNRKALCDAVDGPVILSTHVPKEVDEVLAMVGTKASRE